MIGPNSLVEDSVIGNDTVFNASQCYQSKIHDHVKIGPFCHIRPNSEILDHVKIGDFVEVKNSTIGEYTTSFSFDLCRRQRCGQKRELRLRGSDGKL